MLTNYMSKTAVSEIVESVTDVFSVPLAIANLDGSFLFVPLNWARQSNVPTPEFVKYLVKMCADGDKPVVRVSPELPLAVVPLKFAGQDCAYGIIDLSGVNYSDELEMKKFLAAIARALHDMSIYGAWATNQQVSDVKIETREKVKGFQSGRESHAAVVKQMLESLVSLSLADVALVALIDDKMELLQTEYVAGDLELIPDCLKACSMGLWALHVKQPIVVTDLKGDPRCKRGALLDNIKKVGFWPLFIQDKTFGVLYIASLNPGSEPFQWEYVDNLALNMSFILEDRYRKGQASEVTRKINAINEISKILNSSLDLNKVLDLMADVFMNLFNCGICCVYLKDKYHSSLELMAARGVKNDELNEMVHRFHLGLEKTDKTFLMDFPILVKDREIGYLSMGNFPPGKPSAEDCELIRSFTHMAGIAVENTRMFDESRRTLLETITVLSLAIEARDKTMIGHSEKVRELAVALAEALELPESDISIIESAALLHDIGKLGVAEAVLNKTSALTTFEYEDFKSHPVVGADILKTVTSFEVIGDIVKHHHERHDGQGYPDNLKGEEIPLGSRILTIADTFASLVSKRNYRPARDPFEALEILKTNAGQQFDPDLVIVFEKIIRRRYSLKLEFNRDQSSVIPIEPRVAASELGLTERESEILIHIATGLNNKEIASILHLSEKTVKTHVTHILKKLNLPDRTKAAIYAIQKGLVQQAQ